MWLSVGFSLFGPMVLTTKSTPYKCFSSVSLSEASPLTNFRKMELMPNFGALLINALTWKSLMSSLVTSCPTNPFAPRSNTFFFPYIISLLSDLTVPLNSFTDDGSLNLSNKIKRFWDSKPSYLNNNLSDNLQKTWFHVRPTWGPLRKVTVT